MFIPYLPEYLPDYYIGFLAYENNWEKIMRLFYKYPDDRYVTASFIVEQLKRDIYSYQKNYPISDLVKYLPLPGSLESHNIISTFLINEEDYSFYYNTLASNL